MNEASRSGEWQKRWAQKFAFGQVVLAPLQVVSCQAGVGRGVGRRADFVVELGWRAWKGQPLRFVIETANRSTPRALEEMARQVRVLLDKGEFALLALPFLSPAMLDFIEREELSALDLCGNGVVQVPGRLFVKRSDQPNLFPDTRPLQNPFRGRSACVARAFALRSVYESVTALHLAVNGAGASLSLPQVSKALSRLGDEALVEKRKNELRGRDPARLLDLLAREWRESLVWRRFVSVPGNGVFADLLNAANLHWCVAGPSSVGRYATFAQGGPMRLIVSDLDVAREALGAEIEPAAAFADFELCQSAESGYFFDARVDEAGVRWASPIQTFVELQAGDARGQEAAKDVRRRILEALE